MARHARGAVVGPSRRPSPLRSEHVCLHALALEPQGTRLPCSPGPSVESFELASESRREGREEDGGVARGNEKREERSRGARGTPAVEKGREGVGRMRVRTPGNFAPVWNSRV